MTILYLVIVLLSGEEITLVTETPDQEICHMVGENLSINLGASVEEVSYECETLR